MSTEFRIGQRVRVIAQVRREYLTIEEARRFETSLGRVGSTILRAPALPDNRSESWEYERNDYRHVLRVPLAYRREGIVLGWTVRYPGIREYEPEVGPIFVADGKGSKVWRVQPDSRGQRWTPPIDALAEDLELLEEEGGERKSACAWNAPDGEGGGDATTAVSAAGA